MRTTAGRSGRSFAASGLLALAATGALAAPAPAALVDHGTTTLDTATGFEWLDLTETLGLSPAQALATHPGMRFATLDEMLDYLEKSAGFSQVQSGLVPAVLVQDEAPAQLLLALMGQTGTVLGQDFGRGHFEVGPGVYDRATYLVGVFAGGGAARARETRSAAQSSPDTGNFLVLAPPATTLSLEPASQSVPALSPVSLDIALSGAPPPGPAVPPTTGALSVRVSYDPGLLSFTGATPAAALGDPAATGPVEVIHTSSAGGGQLAFDVVSLVVPATLVSLQATSQVALATLEFTALAPGQAVLDFQQDELWDETGTAFSVEARTGATITVPEPAGPLPLFFAGLLLRWLVGRRRVASGPRSRGRGR